MSFAHNPYVYHSSKINNNINAINIGYQTISQYDESAIAKQLSNDLSVPFYNQIIDDKIFKLTLAEYLNIQQDMPTADPNTLLMYLLSKTIIKYNAKVLLVGEGGDEIGGYPIYKTLQSEYNLLKYLPNFIAQQSCYFTRRLEANLPFSLKMKQGAKSLIKESAKKYLPQYILKHPKVGFGMLLTPFLRNTLPQWFEKELIKNNSQLHSYIDKKYLVSMLSKHNQKKNLGYQMWILYALHRWLQIND